MASLSEAKPDDQRPSTPQTGNNNDDDNNAENNKIRSQTQALILLQSPIWIVAVAYVMQTGVLRTWTDAEYLLFSIAVATLSLLIPFILLPSSPQLQSQPRLRNQNQNQQPKQQRHHPHSTRSYLLKLHLWTAIQVFTGTYLGTAYFFDLMGMHYNFSPESNTNDKHWSFSSDVTGCHNSSNNTHQAVPVFLYPLTHAYFMTYFAALLSLERWLVRSLRIQPSSLSSSVARAGVVLALAYGLAFLETWFMASPLLEGIFAYESRERMLKVGSVGYSVYFVMGLPMARRIEADGERWTFGRVAVEGLATSMMVLLGLEAWAKTVGPL